MTSRDEAEFIDRLWWMNRLNFTKAVHDAIHAAEQRLAEVETALAAAQATVTYWESRHETIEQILNERDALRSRLAAVEAALRTLADDAHEIAVGNMSADVRRWQMKLLSERLALYAGEAALKEQP